MRKFALIPFFAVLGFALVLSARAQYSTDPIGAGYYDSWIPPIVFEVGWTNATLSGAYLGAVGATQTFGARAVFSIWGDAITIYYTMSSFGGWAEICVDSTLGPLCADVNMFNSTTTNLNAIGFQFLGHGFHDVVIQKRDNNSTFIYFDAFQVHPPPFATPEPLEVIVNLTIEPPEFSVSITQEPPAWIDLQERTIGEESRQLAFDYRVSTADMATGGLLAFIALMLMFMFAYLVFFGRRQRD